MKSIKQLAQALATTATLLLAQPIQAETYYFHNDHLGTPQAVTDTAGEVVWQGSYSPFGEATESTAEVEQNIRFPGQYFEEETGLHYNYFRDYDPGTGRYIESDPIGLQGGINTFGYVGGSPTQLSDPDGLRFPLRPFVRPGVRPYSSGISAYYPPIGDPFPSPITAVDTSQFPDASNDSDYTSCNVGDDNGGDPCEEWLNNLLEIVLVIKFGGSIDDLTKREFNEQIKKFKHACPFLAGEIGYL